MIQKHNLQKKVRNQMPKIIGHTTMEISVDTFLQKCSVSELMKVKKIVLSGEFTLLVQEQARYENRQSRNRAQAQTTASVSA